MSETDKKAPEQTLCPRCKSVLWQDWCDRKPDGMQLYRKCTSCGLKFDGMFIPREKIDESQNPFEKETTDEPKE